MEALVESSHGKCGISFMIAIIEKCCGGSDLVSEKRIQCRAIT